MGRLEDVTENELPDSRGQPGVSSLRGKGQDERKWPREGEMGSWGKPLGGKGCEALESPSLEVLRSSEDVAPGDRG